MRVLGLAGWSGSGKTTLLVRLLPELTRRGIAVSTIKHAHHEFDIDQAGKDSYEHRAAGAREVLVASSRRYALMHELRGAREPTLDELIGRMAPVDLVLVEGYKRDAHDKIEVYRAALGKPPLGVGDTSFVAIATDSPAPGVSIPQLALDRPAEIADFIVRHCGLAPARSAAL
jgi:molybdopterin-guanine dinucleotide biosynthesis protein B